MTFERRQVIAGPAMPMAVARSFISSLYMTADGPGLRYHRRVPHLWKGTQWSEVAERDMRSIAYHYLEAVDYIDHRRGVLPWSPTKRKLDDVMDVLEAITLLETGRESPFWIDARTSDPPAHEIVSMQNGLLHVPTRALLPHTPRLFIHNSLPFPFYANAPWPARWVAFLSDLWPDDQTAVDVLQEITGYLLAGGTGLQKIFLIVGPKRAGKGTIARVLTELLGSKNVAAPTLSSLVTNFGLAPLIGKPVAIVADARLGPRAESHVVVERLLSISGEDSLTIDRKFRDPWTGRLPTRFLILTNELPRLTDASGALSSRFVPLVLTKSFYGLENPRLTLELLAEAPGIFVWGLAGLDRLLARGYFQLPSSSREVMQRLDDFTSPMAAFLRARCVIRPDARISCDALWQGWRIWCELENRPAGTRAMFGRDLHAAAPTVRRVRRGGEDRPYEYGGITLLTHEAYSGDDLGLPGQKNADRPGSPRSSASCSSQERAEEFTDGRF